MWLKFLYLLFFVSLVVCVFSFAALRKRNKISVKITAFLKGTVFLVLAIGFLFIATTLNQYRILIQEIPLADIIARRIESEKIELIFKPLDKPGESIKLTLQGDQWMIGGDILRWKRPLYLLGLKNLHKLTRISGRFLSVEKETRSTHYELNSGTDRLWLFLYRNQRFLPFVEAVYGNSVYTFPKERTIFRLYVTASGYLIKEEPFK